MKNFDRLRQKAPQILDEEAAQKFETELTDQQVSKKNDDIIERNGIISAENVNFTNQASTVMNHLSSNSPRKNILPKTRKQSESNPPSIDLSVSPIKQSMVSEAGAQTNTGRQSTYEPTKPITSHSAILLGNAIKGEYAYGILGGCPRMAHKFFPFVISCYF